MCGRAYSTYTEEELYLRYLNKRPPSLPHFAANYNFCPTQLAPVVLVKDGVKAIELLRWGLIPSWAQSIQAASKYSLINARGEEIDQKRSYLAAFEKRRCIIPLSGFFEWKREDAKNKRPFAIHLKGQPIMSVAGVWEHWSSPETSEVGESFSIITTAANSFMEGIHNRMPVILAREDEDAWLSSEKESRQALKSFLRPCPSECC